MTIDPKVSFWLGLVVSVALAIANGTILLKGAVPAGDIPYIVSWCSIIGNIGTLVMTAFAGANMTTSGRIAAAANADGVKGMQVDPKIALIATQAAGTNAKITT